MLALSIPTALWVLLGLALLISAGTDLYSGRILNPVTYSTLVIALVARLLAEGLGGLESGALSGIAGALVGAAPLAAVAGWTQGVGWGDVKLVAAVGAALGFPLVIAAVLFISIAGAAQALLFLLWERVRPRRDEASSDRVKRRNIPYGVAIAAGSFGAMLWQHSNSFRFNQ